MIQNTVSGKHFTTLHSELWGENAVTVHVLMYCNYSTTCSLGQWPSSVWHLFVWSCLPACQKQVRFHRVAQWWHKNRNISLTLGYVSESLSTLTQLAGTYCVLVWQYNMTDSWHGRPPGSNPSPSHLLVCLQSASSAPLLFQVVSLDKVTLSRRLFL